MAITRLYLHFNNSAKSTSNDLVGIAQNDLFFQGTLTGAIWDSAGVAARSASSSCLTSVSVKVLYWHMGGQPATGAGVFACRVIIRVLFILWWSYIGILSHPKKTRYRYFMLWIARLWSIPVYCDTPSRRWYILYFYIVSIWVMHISW